MLPSLPFVIVAASIAENEIDALGSVCMSSEILQHGESERMSVLTIMLSAGVANGMMKNKRSANICPFESNSVN